ncbi:MAG: NAD(P)/FAD-dependent oxidoreductase [Rubrivivax sp.]
MTHGSGAIDSADETDRSGTHDVLVIGGGLAGLTLALQLKDRFADIDVLVLERRRHPVPVACHKVGESTVEIGAHYLAEVLGLREHLQQQQLPKFGFRFFFSDARRDIHSVGEIGASRPLPVPSYQIDRGRFENFLGHEAQRRGVRFIDDATVNRVDPASGDNGTALHRIDWHRGAGAQHSSRARWLIDASGRAGVLKRKFALAQGNAHDAHAVWLRIGERLCIDEWSDDSAWRARCSTPTRWLSTNHLVGEGYWVWLIPLASGSHSVGIVADPAFHALDSMNTVDKALEWLRVRQPRLHDELAPRRHKVQDFAFFRHFSHDCAQLLSSERWAITGEAGRFLDPFYSPGTDFIAIGNTFISELIARDRAGKPLAAHVQIYEQVLRSFHDSTMTLYAGQYGLFGDAELLPLKVLWDYSYYWSVPAQLFFHKRLADLALLSKVRDELQRCQQLNLAVQCFLREWSRQGRRHNPAVLHDQAALPWFVELNRSLGDTLDDDGVRRRLQQAPLLLATLATELLQRCRDACPALDSGPLRVAIDAAGGPRTTSPPLLPPLLPPINAPLPAAASSVAQR